MLTNITILRLVAIKDSIITHEIGHTGILLGYIRALQCGEARR